MTRKRAVKLLMARGYSRNQADSLMRAKPPQDSNAMAYISIASTRFIWDNASTFLQLFTCALRGATEAMSQLSCSVIELAEICRPDVWADRKKKG